MVGTAWWIAGMWVYIKNKSIEENLILIDGTDTFPILWWWERLGEAAEDEESAPKYLYIAVSLLV